MFDPDSTYSYMSLYFASCLYMPRGSLDAPVHVSTPIGDSLLVDRVYRSCVVTVYGFDTKVDFLLLEVVDFDVILGMDWLCPYHVILDYHAKTVMLAMLGLLRIKVDSKKIEAVQISPRPSTTAEIRSFFGLVSYYHRFVEAFTSTTVKSPPFKRTDVCEEIFQKLKTTLTTTPMLVLPS
uniref:RNA-directed DNA polymerase homolog n=1 Tax=Nicotiana tabacum TaxID=4097 RepID=A0A1S3XQW1_TOBAC|nr:PREDICTED: uncharacterized protein LOC107767685 [Nicotiana tabacum]